MRASEDDTRPGPGRGLQPRPARPPAPGGDRDPAARRRGASSSCCSCGARRRRASWAACGCSRAAPSTPRRAPATRAHRAAAIRELREEAAIELDDPGALVKFSRWITPAQVQIRFDTHFFLAPLPDGPGAADRRRGVRRPRLVHAAGRARRAPRGRDRARVPDDQAPRAAAGVRVGRRAARATPARGRWSRSSRASCSRARSRASCCRASPATSRRARPAPPSAHHGRAARLRPAAGPRSRA